MRYIVGHHYKGKARDGKPINLKRFTAVESVPYDSNADDLQINGRKICLTTSHIAHEFFARDDDGQGDRRYCLTRAIISTLATNDNDHQARWDRLWAREADFGRFRRKELGGHWIWNHDFYNAEIEDLEAILNAVKGVN